MRRADKLTIFICRLSRNSGSLRGCPGLYKDCFTDHRDLRACNACGTSWGFLFCYEQLKRAEWCNVIQLKGWKIREWVLKLRYLSRFSVLCVCVASYRHKYELQKIKLNWSSYLQNTKWRAGNFTVNNIIKFWLSERMSMEMNTISFKDVGPRKLQNATRFH